MSRRAILSSLLVTAAVAVALTLMIVALLAQPESPDHSPAAVATYGEMSETDWTTQAPPAPTPPPMSFAALTRESVDWAAVYAKVVPSLVTVGTELGAGSGFFVTTDGHVITNLHVVSGAQRISVYLQDGERFDAELLARDVGSDLALLSVDTNGAEVVVPIFASIDDLRIGDPVGALGAPFNLPNSLTVGIISGLGRTRPSGNDTWEPIRAMIQTDAALNPGNSGGMLVDERGRVIGIPTQIESPDGVSNGIGFAVSADTLIRSLPTMLSGKDYERAHLGVTLEESEDALEVVGVVCGSTADEVGIRVGDRLLEVNGQPADSLEELIDALATVSPGEEMVITIQRRSRQLTLEATAKGWPSTLPRLGCG